MSNRRRNNPPNTGNKTVLPPIITEDDGELPFFKQDFFSDVALIVSTAGETSTSSTEHHASAQRTKPVTVVAQRKLFTARSILAYNSPVFEKSLANAKKHELDLSNKSYDDVIELLCYLDPRVPYTITAQTAKQLLPLAEEYEIPKLRRGCETALFVSYTKLRKEHKTGDMPTDVNEEYLMMADRFGFDDILRMCVDEYVSTPSADMAKSVVNSEVVSERVKLLILQMKLSKLNRNLETERRYRNEAEHESARMHPKTLWKKYWY